MTSRSLRRVVLAATLVSAGLALPAQAQDPQATRTPERTQPPLSELLDMGFGTEGRATTSRFGGDRSAMALQPDGAVVMVGGTFVDFVMARFLADGTLDPGFGEGGMVTTDLQPDQQEEALAVAIAPDGSIVVAGYSGFDATMALARYLPDGSLDPSFGTGGIVAGTTPGRLYAVAIDAHGHIVVAGGRDIPDGTTDFSDLLLARFLVDGTLDTSFGEEGVVVVDVDGATNTLRELAILPDGRILASGESFGSFEGSERTDLVRVTPEGALDLTFGGVGAIGIDTARVGEGMAVQPDGRIVLTGRALLGTETRLETLRLEIDGALDTSFGDGGSVRTDLRDHTEAGLDVALDAEGRIVVAGRAGDINTDFAVVRYLPDGSLDTAFADEGQVFIDFFMFPDIAESVAIGADGLIVVGGFAQQIDADSYGVARVLP
ncbi:MAG: hypothetical protein ABWZ82_03555 [Candidatus Limnocylindrales bacterium]